jgi:signal transduction histidine kinase
MITTESSNHIGNRSATTTALPTRDLDVFECEWEKDLRDVGLEPERSAALRIGVQILALSMLGAAVLVALLAPDSGRNLAPLAFGLVLVAAYPWARWIVRGDDGPTWTFVALSLAPIAVLGIGHWFVDGISLGSDVAYPLLAFPSLLLVVLGVAYAPDRMAVGFAIAAYVTFTVPLLAAWVSGRNVDSMGVVARHVGFVFGIVAGYAVRLSHSANIAVTEAREALAWQAIAEERRRVARDVHDVVAHTLAITMLHITAARMAVRRSDPAEAEEALEEAERHGRASLADIRRIVRLLRADDSSALDAAQPGLVDVEALVEGYRAAGLPVELSLAAGDRFLSPTAESAVYRVLQEALTNAARHGSGPATVDLRVTNSEISLQVDNPVDQHAARRTPGSGLLGMKERISAAGGAIEAGVQNGHWIVRAVVPGEAGE